MGEFIQKVASVMPKAARLIDAVLASRVIWGVPDSGSTILLMFGSVAAVLVAAANASQEPTGYQLIR
jgi:hypothetical protein